MMKLPRLLSLFTLMFSVTACGLNVQSEQKGVEYAQTEWTLVRKVGGQHSLEQNLPPGASIKENKIYRKGSGPVVYGPYKEARKLKRFRLDAKVKLNATYEGEKKCYKHEGSWLECINGCPRVEYDCSEPPGRVLIDVVMKHPQMGLGQDTIGSQIIEVSKEKKNVSGYIPVLGDMIRNNQDLDMVELRVSILDDWVSASVEETVLGFRGWYK